MQRDPILEAIQAAMADQKKKPADLGRLLGLDGAQVARIFETRPGKQTRKLQIHELRKVEQWLGWSPGVIGAATGGVVLPMPGMVPLYGLVGATSASKLTIAEQSIRGYVPMHPAQQNLRDAFALEVADVSMSPRYELGEVVYVAPHRWPLPGQDGVLVDASSYGHLKRFLRREASVIRMHQLNPDDDLEFSTDQVLAMHAVVGRG